MPRIRTILSVAIFVVVVAMLLAACGGDSVTGTYAWSSGEETMKDITLELKDDGTFVLSGDSATMGNVNIQGKYTTEGDKVSLTLMGDGGSTESEVGTYSDGMLVFDDISWKKQ